MDDDGRWLKALRMVRQHQAMMTISIRYHGICMYHFCDLRLMLRPVSVSAQLRHHRPSSDVPVFKPSATELSRSLLPDCGTLRRRTQKIEWCRWLWRSQKFWKGETMYQPRRHLSQTHIITVLFEVFFRMGKRRLTGEKKILLPLANRRERPPQSA